MRYFSPFNHKVVSWHYISSNLNTCDELQILLHSCFLYWVVFLPTSRFLSCLQIYSIRVAWFLKEQMVIVGFPSREFNIHQIMSTRKSWNQLQRNYVLVNKLSFLFINLSCVCQWLFFYIMSILSDINCLANRIFFNSDLFHSGPFS